MSGGIRNEDDLNYMAGTSKPKWVPGQRLNTAAEVMQALLDGEKLRYLEWGVDDYVVLNAHGLIVQEDGEAYEDSDWHGFSINTPPEAPIRQPTKRKVVSTRWFAVFEDSACLDKAVWRGPYLCEADVKEDYPNALAYTCATVEVGVEG